MLPPVALILAAALAFEAQQAQPPSLEDARALSKLADELKLDLEKNDYNVLSLATLKKVDEIDKLAKRIHDRLKRF
jgi:hypothetical protein